MPLHGLVIIGENCPKNNHNCWNENKNSVLAMVRYPCAGECCWTNMLYRKDYCINIVFVYSYSNDKIELNEIKNPS